MLRCGRPWVGFLASGGLEGLAAPASARRWLSDAQRVAAEDGPASGQQHGPRVERKSGGSFLARHGRDLTREAAEGLLDPVLGREDVVKRCLQILLRRTKNNPVLIGDPGVGKTAVAEGIAQLLAGVGPRSGLKLALPPGLQGHRMVALDLGSLVAGTQYRGALEERLQGVLREVRASRGKIILFIDELHMLVDAGRVEGGMDAANLLKPALARGELHCVGATTVEEYRKHIEADAAFARRFQAVMVEEPSPEAALHCLQGLRPRYEAHHGVRLADSALEAAVTAAQRYIPDRRLPDSAIDVMDQAASRARLQAAAAAAAASEAAAAAAAPSEAAETAEAAAEPVHSRAAGPAFGGGSAGGGGGTFGGAAVWGQGLRWSPSPSLGSNRSPDEERELLEWFGGTVEQRKAGGGDFGPAAAAGEQQLALPGLSGAAESSAAAGLGQQQGLAGAAPGRQLLHQQQQLQPGPGAAMLPCPHCGTPTPSKSGALTVVCPKCRACFLNLPPSTLMLGTSLFLRKAGQGQGQGQGHDQSRGQSAQLPPAPAGSTSDGAVPRAESPAVAGTAAVASPASGATASSLTRPGQAGPGGQQDAPAGADTRPVVEAADVLAVVAEAAGVPLSHVSRTDWESQLTLETSLLQQVAGQDAAVRTAAGAVRLGRLGLQRGRRPLASFVLSGPRGVGRKTLCKALATSLFASERLLHFDMSECADRTAVSRLVGAAPGYVGYGEGGVLTEAVRRRPHSVVVLEHAERAHPEVLNLLMQAVEQGHLSDSMGRQADFRNAIVVFTTTTPATATATATATTTLASSSSAAGAADVEAVGSAAAGAAAATSVPVLEHGHAQLQHQHQHSSPWNHHAVGGGAAASQVGHSAAALSLPTGEEGRGGSSGGGPAPGGQQPGGAPQHLPPQGRLPAELAGLVDAVVQLEPLSATAMQQVAAMQLQECGEMLQEQGAVLEVSEGVPEWLAARGMSSVEGARPLQRLLREHVLGPAAHALLEHRMEQAQRGSTAADGGCRLRVTVAEGGAGLDVCRVCD